MFIRSIKRSFLPALLLFLLCGCDNKNVILDEEYLTIRIDRDRTVHVHVRCIFRNTESYCSTLAFPVTDWFKIYNFAAKWNGEDCVCDIVSAPEESLFLIDGRHYRSVYRYDIPCSGTETSEHIITYSYRMPFISFMKEYNARGHYLEYILHTGGLWYGNVSKLRVEIISETGFLKNKIIQLDGGYRGEVTGDGRWIFNADNIELKKDIRLLLMTDSSDI